MSQWICVLFQGILENPVQETGDQFQKARNDEGLKCANIKAETRTLSPS